MAKDSIYAVLTGDLVKSTDLSSSQLDDARDELLESVREVGRWKRGLVSSKSEFFRGDAWQVLLTDPALALRVALFLRARVKAQDLTDTRIAIGIGEVGDISKSRVSLSSGEAFVLSGHALDNLTSLERMAIALPVRGGVLGQWTPAVASLLDALSSEWKPRQAEIVSLALSRKEFLHEQIAESLEDSVTKQAVTKSLRGANWHAVKKAIDQFEETDWGSLLA